MTEIKLSKRLQAIAELIPPYGGVVDVGTDHGYIPLWLLQKGFKGHVSATDINEGPLNSAKASAKELDMENRMSFHLCDGLATVDPSTVSTVVIAGMGGENISAILQAAPWTKRGKVLILQPMSKAERLRKWLYDNDYCVIIDTLVEDGAIYELLVAIGGQDKEYTPAQLQTGHYNLVLTSPLFPSRLDALIEKYRRALKGLSNSNEDTENRRKSLLSELAELMAVQENIKFGGANDNS